ncbi:neuronal acetylcholine receptor subunit alpha-5-like [Convolutriloba macropyga]|uniref:neuronal acetylcholine receptor subunit alpha-5-like n=1 Tax=Convolutriloba macropyga TaxID=536237 RepID=UPI003F5274BF
MAGLPEERALEGFDLSEEADDLSNGVAEERYILGRLLKSLPRFSIPHDMKQNTVYIYVDLYQILEVDERSGLLSAKLWLYYYYYSPSAMWNLTEYSKTMVLVVPANTFWTADIIALNATEVKFEAFDRQVVYGFNGLVACSSSLITLQLSCSLDVSKFPYDTQYCPISFGAWALDRRIYNIGLDPATNLTEANLQYYSEHDQWELVRPASFTLETRQWARHWYDKLTLHVYLKRRPLFYCVIFMVPNAGLYFLTTLVFILPVESGEKASMAVTILLAQIVAFDALTNILPASSLKFPRLAHVIGTIAFHTSIVCLASVIVINVHNMGPRFKMCPTLRCLICSRVVKLLGLQPCKLEKAFPQIEFEKTTQHENPTNQVNGDTKNIQAPLTLAEFCHFRSAAMSSELSDEKAEYLWQYFSHLLDRLFLFCHVIAQMTVLFYFYIRYEK